MEVKNLERKEKSTLTFDVIVSADEFEKAIQSAYLKNKSKLAIPGFRKGKVPRQVLEGMYGKDFFYDEAAESVAQSAFQYCVDSENLRTVGTPSLLNYNVSDEKVLTLSFSTAEWPEAKLGQYKELEAVRPEVNVTDEQVEEDVKRAQKRAGRVVSVDRAAKDGDTTVIDYEGSVDGVPFDGGKAENQTLVLGSGVFIPGFEDQVVGMSAGEEKNITVTFPEDYQAENLKGKEAVFHVKVNEVKEEQLPEIDDEFAKDVSEFDTLDEYKASIRKRIEDQENESADSTFKTNLLEKAAANMECEIPVEMIEAQIDATVEDMDRDLQYNGLNLQMYLSYLGQNIKDFREQNREAAEKTCRVRVLLDKIAKEENFQFSEEDVEAEYEKVADQYQTDVAKVKELIKVDDLKSDMALQKAADCVYDTGKALKAEKAKKAAPKKTTKKAKADETVNESGDSSEEVKEEKPAAKKTTTKKKTVKKETAEEAETKNEEKAD